MKQFPEVKWIPSYVCGAYKRRISLVLDGKAPDFEKARRVAAEFNALVPDYSGSGYGNMLAGITNYKNNVVWKNIH